MPKKLVDQAAERRTELLEISQEQVGKERVGWGSDKRLQKEVIPLNVLDIDDILGGGLRKGRVGMVIGQESMGKTLLAQWVMRAFQQAGEVCGYMDPEKTYDPKWFTKTGVNVDELIVVQPSSTEQAFDLACTWATNGMGLIVIDSLAALTPRARTESTLEKQEFIGLGARKITDGMNLFTNENTDSLLFCTNQVRTSIGVMYGSPETYPGGKALRHYCSYVLRVSRSGWIKEGDDRVGYYMKVEAQKNKTSQPWMSTVIPFMYSGEIDVETGSVELARELGVLVGKSGRYEWGGVKIFGKPKLIQYFRDNPDELGLLQVKIKEASDV